jgi:hypothetical protein
MSYFFSAHKKEETVEAFRAATVEQVIDILIAVSHASSGFLSAFANVQKLGQFVLATTQSFHIWKKRVSESSELNVSFAV